jgi:hypothetical protein
LEQLFPFTFSVHEVNPPPASGGRRHMNHIGLLHFSTPCRRRGCAVARSAVDTLNSFPPLGFTLGRCPKKFIVGFWVWVTGQPLHLFSFVHFLTRFFFLSLSKLLCFQACAPPWGTLPVAPFFPLVHNFKGLPYVAAQRRSYTALSNSSRKRIVEDVSTAGLLVATASDHISFFGLPRHLSAAASLIILGGGMGRYVFHLYHPLYWTSHSGTCSSRISEQLARLATAATILISVECFAPIDAQHFCLGTSIFSSRSCYLEALLSWYKCFLFRNVYTTAGRALLGSRDGLLDWLLQQPFSFRWSALVLSTLSTFVMVQVSSLQECFRHSGMMLLLVLMSACSLGFISAEFLHICQRPARLF